ncbi:hypothetical protein L208DRAFT_1037258, partial [Tricholoma matsutake]
LQLRSCLATHNNQDSLICAGTGSGKTLPIALNLKLNAMIIYALPLMCSIVQANDFNIKYRIPTVALNDDTPREEAYWNASQTFYHLEIL